MPKKIIITNEQIEKVKEMALKGETKVNMAKILNVDRSIIYKIIAQNDIKITKSTANNQGVKYNWTEEKISKLKEMYSSDKYNLTDIVKSFELSEGAIVKKARELGIKKVLKKFLSDENIKFILDNVGKMSNFDIAAKLNVSDEVVSQQINKHGLKQTFNGKRTPLPNNNPKLLEDIGNPAYSDTYLSKTYNYGPSIIKRWRKELYGNRKRMIDTFLNKTSAEMDFEKILDTLDIPYLYEQKIGKWKVDYNLGFHLLVEVQGVYWHSLKKVKEKDARKKSDLENMGYKIIYVKEEDLANFDKIANIILKTLSEQFVKYYDNLYGSLNLVNSKIEVSA